MLFNSLEFILFFFPAVTILYFNLPHRFRWALLLAASCLFYMAFIPVYILILAFTILIDYFAGIYIGKSQGRMRRFYLVLSVVANVGVLCVFKYYNFLNETLATIAPFLHVHYANPYLNIILPLGLSFHTFQAMSYTFEVYYGRQPAEKHFGIYALYVMFYPQLVAGPIERPQNLLPQFYAKHEFDYARVIEGLKLMTWGLFKKVVIADRAAVFVDQVYNQPTAHSGLPLWMATFFFAIQIYCDFSGYSDIAIGAARVMGFKLMTNFQSPYLSKSVREFWKRWHISLSTWFRDYLYIPMGGSQVKVSRLYINLMITFIISGLWHGANWTFVIWGALNGFYIIFAIWISGLRSKLSRGIHLHQRPFIHSSVQIAVTFFLICFAWIFFRAANLSDACYIASHLFVVSDRSVIEGLLLGQPLKEFIILAAGILSLLSFDYWQIKRGDLLKGLTFKPVWFRWGIYYGVLLIMLVFGKFGDGANQFIYFQF